MTSKSIYTSTKSLPYVYKCVHKETGKFYIGYRSANKIPSTEDLPIYKTSSKIIKPNFGDYEWEILAEFFDADSAYNYEQQLIFEEWSNPLILNLNCQYNGRKLRSNVGSKHSEETKRKVSESKKRANLPAWNKGLPQTDDHKLKQSIAMKGRNPHNKGKSGIQTAWNKGLPQRQVICPHCGKTGGHIVMGRHHFENCKFKPST